MSLCMKELGKRKETKVENSLLIGCPQTSEIGATLRTNIPVASYLWTTCLCKNSQSKNDNKQRHCSTMMCQLDGESSCLVIQRLKRQLKVFGKVDFLQHVSFFARHLEICTCISQAWIRILANSSVLAYEVESINNVLLLHG